MAGILESGSIGRGGVGQQRRRPRRRGLVSHQPQAQRHPHPGARLNALSAPLRGPVPRARPSSPTSARRHRCPSSPADCTGGRSATGHSLRHTVQPGRIFSLVGMEPVPGEARTGAVHVELEVDVGGGGAESGQIRCRGLVMVQNDERLYLAGRSHPLPRLGAVAVPRLVRQHGSRLPVQAGAPGRRLRPPALPRLQQRPGARCRAACRWRLNRRRRPNVEW
jgi:hypothetical protein